MASVFVIREGRVDHAELIGNPALVDSDVCETAFGSYEDAAQSLIDTGWLNPEPWVQFHLGAGVWVRPESEAIEDEDGPVTMVRYIHEVELALAGGEGM